MCVMGSCAHLLEINHVGVLDVLQDRDLTLDLVHHLILGSSQQQQLIRVELKSRPNRPSREDMMAPAPGTMNSWRHPPHSPLPHAEGEANLH